MIGIHIKTKRIISLSDSFKYCHDIGCTHIQIFNDTIKDYAKVKTLLKKNNLGLFVHGPYIINIASKFDVSSWKTRYFVMEVENAIKCGAIGFVVHMGKQIDMTKKEAYDNMYNILRYVSKKSKKRIDIYVEMTAGQGNELCYKLDDLKEFYDRIKRNSNMSNIKICIDTCHIFSAGYDIRTKKGVKKYLREVDKKIGMEYIGLVHLNDSANDIDSRLDRHANIGEGYIGKEGLQYFYKCMGKFHIPVILETPMENYKVEIEELLR